MAPPKQQVSQLSSASAEEASAADAEISKSGSAGDVMKPKPKQPMEKQQPQKQALAVVGAGAAPLPVIPDESQPAPPAEANNNNLIARQSPEEAATATATTTATATASTTTTTAPTTFGGKSHDEESPAPAPAQTPPPSSSSTGDNSSQSSASAAGIQVVVANGHTLVECGSGGFVAESSAEIGQSSSGQRREEREEEHRPQRQDQQTANSQLASELRQTLEENHEQVHQNTPQHSQDSAENQTIRTLEKDREEKSAPISLPSTQTNLNHTSNSNSNSSNNNNYNSFITVTETSAENYSKNNNHHQERPIGALEGTQQFCKRRRLSYLQALLLRRWPCLAITICIMTSLLFGMLLSALTVYLMHEVTDCSGLALAAAGAARSPLAVPPHELMGRPADFDSPLDVAVLASSVGSGGGGGGGHSEELGARSFALGSGNSEGSAAQAAGAANSSAQSADRPRFQRLPSSLWPLHYDLFVQPYIAEPFNFTGKVSIRIRCKEATDNITLHTLDLELNEKTLKLEPAPQEDDPAKLTRLQKRESGDSGAPVVPKISGLSQDKQLQYSIVRLDGPLVAGKEYVLSIDFVGTLNDDLAGFYKIRYERQNSSETTWIAATQFQATDARRAFPCFDEPLYKATFGIKIKHWKNMTALSNMPIVESKESSDGLWITDTFGKSHKMSTYLVAYAVTNFESRSEGNISVWTRPGFAHTAEYALKIAGKILRHYEDFFGIEYPLPKMDMIALPDFNAGAMENWGLITYRETAMLYDETTSSVANKQRVAVVVAHELAHQWFGNLVTPKWWDDLWLNEGFASFVEYIGVDHVEPKWQMLDQFVVEEVQNVFKMDGLSSSHQISIPVNNPDEISEIFDHISYAKGASIIRMMNHFLTDNVFKTGLKRYLRALKYSNAEQSDLWAHLTEAQKLVGANSSMVDVERVMNSWTLQTGFPLVTLTRDYGKSSARLDQVRYQSFRVSKAPNGSESASVKGQKWEIPVTLTWKSEQNWEPRTRIWMHQNDTAPTQLDSSLVPKSDDEWMLVNLKQVGYYRVNYDARNWKLLIDQLMSDHKKISSTNRAQILDDIFELAKSATIDYSFAMDATKYLKNEKDYLPWDTVLMSFSYIDDMLQRTAIYGDWKDYIADLISPYYEKYKNLEWTTTAKSNATMDANDVLEQYNQVNAIAWACQVKDHCIKQAKSVFSEWRRSGKNQIQPALRYTTYCTAIENGDKEDWDFLWKIYEKEQNASERDRIMRALGCSREIWILSRYLEWTFNKSKHIRRQDGAYVFRMIAKNNYGRDIAFNFMRERWSTIKEYYGKTSFSLGNLIRSVSTSMNTQVELNQLNSFYESIKADVGTGKRSFQIAIEEVESNVAWRNRNYKTIEDWIQRVRS